VSRPTTPTPPPRPDRARKETRSADDRDQHARTAPPQGDVVGRAGEPPARGRMDGVAEHATPDPGPTVEDEQG